MNEASRGVWGWAAALALLVSIGFSWRLLPLRSLPGSGREVQERMGLLSAVSRRPEFAFGFRNVLADIVWLQAVQVAGNRKMTPTEYDRLYVLLNVEADFDPKFEMPYLLGGLVLGESPQHARKALRVSNAVRALIRPTGASPSTWGSRTTSPSVTRMAGGGAMAEAARLPGSPAYLPGLASRMLSEAREPEAALRLLEPIVRQESDPARRAVLERRIREVTVERDLQTLERTVEWYREKTGSVPADLSALVREGILTANPAGAQRRKLRLDRLGKVRSDRVANGCGCSRHK